jgi:membrane protein
MKDWHLKQSLDFITTLVKQFLRNGGVVNASALTYTTLFAVVPLMTVSYSVLAMIPSFQGVGESVQSWVFSNFVPATGEVVQNYLADFTSQARRLTAVGAIFLFVTSVMMMKNIEAAFNRIWRVKYSRKGMSSFLLYWAILSLGPILIGVGLLVSSYIASLSIISEATAMVGRGNLLSLLPLLLSIAAFSLLYSAVPNCAVPFKNALIGAVVVACLFEVAKRAFALFAVQFPSYELIYGAFAAVPLFLAWIFITWTIILLGAELTKLLTVYNSAASGGFQSHLHTILGVLKKLRSAQLQGRTLSDDKLLTNVSGLNQHRWDEYQQLLLDNGIICRSDRGEYLLARSLDDLTLKQLNDILPWPIPEPHSQNQAVPIIDQSVDSRHWVVTLDNKLSVVKSQQQEVLNVSIETLFDGKSDAEAPTCVAEQQ